MKIFFVMVMMVVFVFSSGLVSFAQKVPQGPYESQLRTYSSFHDELMGEFKSRNIEQKKKNEELKFTDMQLKVEFEGLQSNIEEKEQSIYKLKSINEKLQQAQISLQNQYGELEELFFQQKIENSRLKEELDSSKSVFYQRMLEFYEEEQRLLDDQIEIMTVRRKDVMAKLDQLKEGFARTSLLFEEKSAMAGE